MKKIKIILFLILPTFAFGQDVNGIFEYKMIPEGNLLSHQILYINKNKFKYCSKELGYFCYGIGRLVKIDSFTLFKFKKFKYKHLSEDNYHSENRIDTFKVCENNKVLMRLINSETQEILTLTEMDQNEFRLRLRLAKSRVKGGSHKKSKKLKKKIKNVA